MRRIIFATIILIALIGVAKAGIITAPNPDPAHLVLWYRFDKMYVVQKESWENGWDGWAANPNDGQGREANITSLWATDGNYSVLLHVFTSNGSKFFYYPFITFNKTFNKTSSEIVEIQVDVKVYIYGEGYFDVYVNGNRVFHTNKSYVGTITIPVTGELDEIQFRVYAEPTITGVNEIYAYIDNLRIKYNEFKWSFEQGSENWIINSSGSAYVEISNAWATDGNNSLHLVVDGFPGGRANATVVISPPLQGKYILYMDVNIVNNTGYFNISVNDQIVWQKINSEYTGSVQVVVENPSKIYIDLYTDIFLTGAVSPYTADVYVDNIKLIPIVVDDSGNGNNGTVYGSPQVVPGRYGYGLQFDGVDDYVIAQGTPSLESFATSDNLTIVGWFKLNKLPSSWTALVAYPAPAGVGFNIHYDNHGVIWVWLGLNGTRTLVMGYAYPALVGNWTFIAVTVGHGVCNLYINGKLVKTETLTTSNLTTLSRYLYINKGYTYWSGIADEIRIYNTSLTADQIREMYEALRVKFYDEETLQPLSTANVTIFNANYTITVPVDTVVKAAILFQNQAQWGRYQLKIESNGYLPRFYIIDLINGSLTELNTYLPNASKSVPVTFQITDYTQQFYSNDTTIIIQKPINGVSTTVYQNYLDVEHQAVVYLLKDTYYTISLANSQETRSFGYVSVSQPDFITIYVKSLLQFPLIQYTAVSYNITNNNGVITIQYTTNKGTTTGATVEIYNSTGALVYSISTTTPSGKIVYYGDPNETYTVHLKVDNTFEPLELKIITNPYTISIQYNVTVLTGLPEWVRTMFFGGLCLFVALLFKRSHVPVGLLLSFSLAAIFTILGILPLGQSLLWLLAIVVGLSFFVWWRERR